MSDALLLLGLALLIAGGWTVTPALGLAVAGASCITFAYLTAPRGGESR